MECSSIFALQENPGYYAAVLPTSDLEELGAAINGLSTYSVTVLAILGVENVLLFAWNRDWHRHCTCCYKNLAQLYSAEWAATELKDHST